MHRKPHACLLLEQVDDLISTAALLQTWMSGGEHEIDELLGGLAVMCRHESPARSAIAMQQGLYVCCGDTIEHSRPYLGCSALSPALSPD